jgi:quercetin dioxygenase-like cupin family protein
LLRFLDSRAAGFLDWSGPKAVVEKAAVEKGELTMTIRHSLLAAIIAAMPSVPAAVAQEKKEVYVPTADLKTLVGEPLHGIAGKQVTILHGTFPAGWVGGRHYHTGPVYVYVLEGSFTIDEQGKPRQTFTAGQLYVEPIGIPMQARNISAAEQLKALVFQVHGEGEPLAYKVD